MKTAYSEAGGIGGDMLELSLDKVMQRR